MALFSEQPKPLVAMIHLPPLPGAANFAGRSIRELAAEAVAEARLLAEAGFDGILVQNTHDRPSRLTVPTGVVAALAAIAAHVRDAVDCPFGINVHKNDAEAALAVATAVGADFVRIKVLVGAVVGPEGVVQGSAERALEVRRDYASGIELWADLYELTSWPLAHTPLPNLADLATRFGMADRLIVTDPTVEASVEAVQSARAGTPRPILVGGRTSPATIAAALSRSDGVIVGSFLREAGTTTGHLDQARIRDFLAAAGR